MTSSSSEWPPIRETKLLERLALDDAGFIAFTEKIAALIARRDFSEEALEHALAYPWERPAGSYMLRAGTVIPFDSLAGTQRAALAAGGNFDAGPRPRRFPLLAFGSNAAPGRLVAKFEALPEEHHDVTVISGELHDFDVGASAHAAIYGAMPATIFASPGTLVRAAVLWVTLEQLTAIAWTEMSYFLGRLDGVEFAADFTAPAIDSLLLFVSRLGAHSVDGEVVAMQAIEADRRRAGSMTQLELLESAARVALGSDASAPDLVRGVFEDFAVTTRRVRDTLKAGAVPFESDRWTRFGA